jgi:hypothetical protein
MASVVWPCLARLTHGEDRDKAGLLFIDHARAADYRGGGQRPDAAERELWDGVLLETLLSGAFRHLTDVISDSTMRIPQSTKFAICVQP